MVASQSGGAGGFLARSGPGEPPTPFELLLYRTVAVQGHSLSETVSMFGVPTDDLAENCERVRQWLIKTSPRPRLSADEQRDATERLGNDRLEFLYSEATTAWRQSREQQALTRQPLMDPGSAVNFVRTGVGHASLLLSAARIAILISRYQFQCIAAREKAAKTAAKEAASSGANSPNGDCSKNSGEERTQVTTVASEMATGPLPAISSAKSPVVPGPIPTADARPAQNEAQGGGRGVPPNASIEPTVDPTKPITILPIWVR
jgi:hypothetical protein